MAALPIAASECRYPRNSRGRWRPEMTSPEEIAWAFRKLVEAVAGEPLRVPVSRHPPTGKPSAGSGSTLAAQVHVG